MTERFTLRTKERRMGEVRKRMMKMSRKSGIVAIALIALMCVGVAYAAYYVYSDVVGITLSYQVTLTILSHDGSTIHLKATVTDNSVAANGMTVHFWRTDSGGSEIEYLGSDTTDVPGIALKDYAATGNGDYYFRARLDVP